MDDMGIVCITDRLQWLTAVMEEPGLRGAAYRVAGLLVDYKNSRTGQCNPSLGSLATRLSTDKRNIRRAIRQLEERGYLRTLDSDGGERSRTHQFLFTYPQPGVCGPANGGSVDPHMEGPQGPERGVRGPSKPGIEPIREPGGDKSRRGEQRARYARAPGPAGRLFVAGRFLDED